MSIPSSEMTKTKMFIPESKSLAENLQDGLRSHFEEATVEWVNCPDLTQEPFNFAAPGLGGDAVLLEFGSMSQLFPFHWLKSPDYEFKDVLRQIYDKHSNVFVIGASVGIRLAQVKPTLYQLGELFVNASFLYSQETANFMEFKNKSRLVFMDKATDKCATDSISDHSELITYPHGNLFISEGKPGKVLKVQVKNCIGLPFLTAMQRTLSKYSFNTDPKLVGLGGTFVMKSGRARHHVMPHSRTDNERLNTPTNIHKWLRYNDLDAPLVAVGTLISSSLHYEKVNQHASKKGYGLTESHFHSILCNEKHFGGHFYTELEPTDAEYLGYFRPAKAFYHMHAAPRQGDLQDFNDIMKCWHD